jgi:hypothetical protein
MLHRKLLFCKKDKREPSKKPVFFMTRGDAAQKAPFFKEGQAGTFEKTSVFMTRGDAAQKATFTGLCLDFFKRSCSVPARP